MHYIGIGLNNTTNSRHRCPEAHSPSCEAYEAYLAQNGEAGNGVTTCRICAKHLSDKEILDEENVDENDESICFGCLDNYYVFFEDFQNRFSEDQPLLEDR
jgi:hypothetical protein